MEARRLIVESDDLQAALNANPFYAETRIALFTREISDPDPQALEKAKAVAEEGRAMHPEDGRFMSAVAATRMMDGKEAEAATAFRQALDLLPTDGVALKGSLYFATKNKDWSGFADKFLLLSQRWSNEIETVAPYVKAATQDPVARDTFLSRMADNPRALSDIIRVLADDPETQSAAVDMIMQIDQSRIGALPFNTAGLVASLVSQNRLAEALLLDRYVFARPDKNAGGFVNNGRFSHEPSNSVFDWHFLKNNGVTIERVTARDAESLAAALSAQGDIEPDEKPTVLRLSFQDSPVQVKTGVQTLILPPGKFRLSAVSRVSSSFAGPDPVLLQILCSSSSSMLVSQPLPITGENWQRVSQDFVVQDTACETQRLEMKNKFQTMSWRDRYRGYLEIAEISVVGIQ